MVLASVSVVGVGGLGAGVGGWCRWPVVMAGVGGRSWWLVVGGCWVVVSHWGARGGRLVARAWRLVVSV